VSERSLAGVFFLIPASNPVLLCPVALFAKQLNITICIAATFTNWDYVIELKSLLAATHNAFPAL
jgi:hypothetical protein